MSSFPWGNDGNGRGYEGSGSGSVPNTHSWGEGLFGKLSFVGMLGKQCNCKGKIGITLVLCNDPVWRRRSMPRPTVYLSRGFCSASLYSFCVCFPNIWLCALQPEPPSRDLRGCTVLLGDQLKQQERKK
jgi:hypothetical protein